MNRPNHKFVGIAGIVALLVLMAGMFSATFFLTSYFYAITNLNPTAWIAQVINSLLGLLLTGLIVGSLAGFARSKGWTPEMNMLGPIIEALDKIAQGDFSIRVDNKFANNRPGVGELTDTVNKMALELDQMENVRQEFISNVSHEIQSPLTSIRGFAQALRSDHLSSEENEPLSQGHRGRKHAAVPDYG